MTTRQHRPNHAALSARANRFKALQTELMQASELADTPANRQRIETVALIDLATDSVREAILRGDVVEVGALERLVTARTSILPAANNTSLTVHFVYTCHECRKESATNPEAAAEPEAVSPVKAVVATPAAPATLMPPAPAPANVVALHKDSCRCPA